MFMLHPKLAADTIHLGDFPLARLLLMNDANYPWFILVPKRDAIREIHQLSADDQWQLLQESSHLSRLLEELFNADKLNIAALGNLVPQLHLHHVVRYRNDACWPAPVWGRTAPVAYTAGQVRDIRRRLLGRLADFQPAPS